jgi:hypothetical protein
MSTAQPKRDPGPVRHEAERLAAERKRRARRLVAIALAPAIAALLAGSAFAEPKAKSTAAELRPAERKLPVSLAEVASRVDEAAIPLPNATDLLRKDVEAEIAAADWSKLPPRKHYKLSASIITLDASKVDAKTLRASCTVSVAIRDAKRGTLLAILEGRAKVDDLASASPRAQRDALTGAVRGAIGAVPEAIRRAQ